MKTTHQKISRASILFFLLLLTFSITALSQNDEIRIIVRGDDMGMTQGSLVAFERAFNHGILTAGGVQAVGPWFEGAVELCKRNPGWGVGVHLALIAEWQGYRWRPVLPYDQVPSLVDEDGFLFRYPEELAAHNPDPKEMEAELRAQIELAIKKGLKPQYIDVHYGGLDADILNRIAADYDLPISGRAGETRMNAVYQVPVDQKIEKAVEFLEALQPGTYMWMFHPGIDSPEQNALFHTYPAHIFTGGGVGKHRAAETDVLTSIEVKSVIMRRGIRLMSYKEYWDEQKSRR